MSNVSDISVISSVYCSLDKYRDELILSSVSNNKFRIYCKELKKEYFFYSVEEQFSLLSIKCVFPKNLITVAPKFHNILLKFSEEFSCVFENKKNYYIISDNNLLTVDKVLLFIQNTKTKIKEIIRIMSYYFVPSGFDDVLLKRKKFKIKLNNESKINFGQFVIGRNTKINGAIQSKFGKVFLGQFIAGGFNIEFIAGNHIIQLPNLQATLQKQIDGGTSDIYHDEGTIDIGNNVWIGDNSVFLKNVCVGDGAVIGCNSVVTHDVPPFSVVAGVPAKVIKYRFTASVIEQMMRIQWWNWPMERILAEKRFFSTQIPPDVDFDVYDLLDTKV